MTAFRSSGRAGQRHSLGAAAGGRHGGKTALGCFVVPVDPTRMNRTCPSSKLRPNCVHLFRLRPRGSRSRSPSSPLLRPPADERPDGTAAGLRHGSADGVPLSPNPPSNLRCSRDFRDLAAGGGRPCGDGRAGRLSPRLLGQVLADGWVGQAVLGALFAAVASCAHALCQGQPVGRCRVSRRAERASRPGTVMSWARIVPVVALAWKAEARVPAARVRLNAIVAQTSQALLAQKSRTAGAPAGRSDYKRNGTTTLLAALEVATGKITDACYDRHGKAEFLDFMKKCASLSRKPSPAANFSSPCISIGTAPDPLRRASRERRQRMRFRSYAGSMTVGRTSVEP